MNEQYITSPEQVHYRDLVLVMREGYNGRCSKMTPDEVAAMILEGLNYFGFDDPMALPPPPTGLVGTNPYYHSGAEKMVRNGLYFLIGVLNKEGRTQYNAYSNIGEALSGKFRDGMECERKRQIDKIAAEAMACTDSIDEMRENQLVYFIESAGEEIKVGVAQYPKDRMRRLQTAHPKKLSLLATCPGGLSQERAYHEQFAEHRLEGEWFKRHADILAEIDRINASKSVG